MVIISRRGPPALSWLVISYPFLSLVIAEIMNATIDDTNGDSQTGLRVTYLPETPGVWQTPNNCSDCSINPNVANAFEGTYTAATYYPSTGSVNITMEFNGTAIYVFFILANDEGFSVSSSTRVNFILDGNPPQLFQHFPLLLTSSIEYNQLVFSQTNLINNKHTLVISTSGIDEPVWVNFDYAIYTHDNDTLSLPLTENSSPVLPQPTLTNTTMITDAVPPRVTVTATSTALPSASALGNFSNKKSNSSTTGLVTGGVIFAIALISFLIYSYFRRRRIKWLEAMKGDHDVTAISPFILPTPNATQSTGPLYGVVKGTGMSDTMREQPRSMREPIVYQQQSASTQELFDDPPPEYTLARTASRYSAPLPTTAL